MIQKCSNALLRSRITFSAAPMVTCRYISGPSVKSYAPLTSPVKLWWTQKVPLTAKYASALVTTAIGVTHIHPNTLITLGPPALAAGYFVFRRIEHAKYVNSVQLVKNPGIGGRNPGQEFVNINKYDPADEANVLAGIENEFDSFRSQIIPIVRSKLVEYVIDNSGTNKDSQIVQTLLDENQQVLVHVEEDPETFVTSKAESEVEGTFPQFISFSVPYYSSRNAKTRKRLGSLQVSMLEVVGEEKEIENEKENEGENGETVKTYRLAIQAWPYKMFSTAERIY